MFDPMVYLARTYGVEAVDSAGLEVLGYPAAWVTSFREKVLIEKFLTSQR